MWARRIQLYWFPIGSTLAVGAAAAWLDLAPRAALLRGSYGIAWPVLDTSSFLTWSVAILVAAWSAQALTDRPRRPSAFSHPAYYFAGGILYADLLVFLGANGRAFADTGVSVWAFLGIVPAAWLANHLAAKLEDARARTEGEWDAGPVRRPALRLRRTEAALWVGRREAWGYPATIWIGVLLLAALIVMMLERPGGLNGFDVVYLSLQAGAGAYWLATTTVRVTVTEAAVRVVGGPLSVPLWTIPLEDLVDARVEVVRPRHYAGYGYRAKGGRRCLIVRAGDALVLSRRRGRDVVVTVDGAEEGAGLLNALLQRRSLARAS